MRRGEAGRGGVYDGVVVVVVRVVESLRLLNSITCRRRRCCGGGAPWRGTRRVKGFAWPPRPATPRHAPPLRATPKE